MSLNLFPLFYEIENFENYIIFNNGKIFSRKSNKFLKAGINRDGYQFVNLCNENGRHAFTISRLVAEHFIENTENKTEVDHINQNKLNNHYTNLRWCSHQENCLNRNKFKNNKSGFIGVYLENKYHRWRADFYKNGKRIRKNFSFQKNNETNKEEKFREACEWRQQKTNENYDKKYFNGNS
jgi:hypothetical protein